MITQPEVAASGITTDEFSDIADSTGEFLRRVVVQRYNPVFTLHDSNVNTAFQFSVSASDTKIVRAVSDTANLLIDTLAVESDNQASPNSWSSAAIIEALHSPSIVNVKCVRQASAWDVFFQRSTGRVGRAHSTDGASWTVTDFSSYVLPLDGTLEWISYGNGGIEMVYYVTTTPQNSHWLQAIDASGNHYDTGIYWHENFSGMDCEAIIDNSTDSTGDVTGENIRHVLTFAAALPGYFTYQNSNGLPVQIFIESGGIISFVVRPPVTGSYRPVMVGQHHMVRHFDRVSTINYRHTAHMTPMNSIFDAANGRDMVWVASLGEDGDFNTTDTSLGYQALYYYNSRDGINWSQDRIVPIDGIPDLGHYATGIQLVKCGHYVYLISAQTTLRSPLTAEFGPVVHPDLQIDVSKYILEYSSSQSDMRNTQVVLDNRDSHFNSTMLGGPGSFTLITSIGKREGGIDYLFQVAIEHVDALQFIRQRPQERLTITARDRMSWLTDRSQSADAIQHDNQIAGMDNFAPIASTSSDSGLAHTAVVSGSFATVDHKLHLSSKYKEGIAFNTFSTSIADGAEEIIFWLPNPHTRDTSGGPINGTATPTYAGIIYRAIDKDNFWFVYYDFFAQAINIGYRIGGTNISLGFYDPGVWFNGQATTENYMTMHVEFRYSKIKVWIKLSDGKLHNLVDQLLPGQGPGFTPFMQGYVGVIGAGWSDEDTAAIEPPPIVPVIDPVTLDDLSPFGDTGSVDPTAPVPYPVGTVVKLSGENVFAGSSSHSYWLKNYISLATPTSHNNTPGSFSGWAIQAVLTKPNPTTMTVGGYVLAYNTGSDKSAVWSAPDIWSGSPVWTKGADQDGKWTILRASNVTGEILIESSSRPGPLSAIVDFYTAYDPDNSPGSGYTGVVHVGDVHTYTGTNWDFFCGPRYDITLRYSSGVAMTLSFSPSDYPGSCVNPWTTHTDDCASGGCYDYSHPPVSAWDGLSLIGWSSTDPLQVTVTITHIYGTVDTQSEVRSSSNDGATFGSSLVIGDTPATIPISGFDVSRNSATSYATCHAKVRKATSLGGPYSDFVAFSGANPVCVIVPYYRRGSDTLSQIADANPDFVAALDGPDGVGGTLYWVDGASGTKHNITPVAGMVFNNPNCVTTHYGTHIAVFGKVGGVYRLYVSTNAGGTWTYVKDLTAPTFIRGRRTNPYSTRGQIYLADNGSMYYSSHWGAFGMFIRHMPASIICFDTVW